MSENAAIEKYVPSHLLQLFAVLYERGTVTETAAALQISQPTASSWLAELRKELADPLFVRSHGRMRPTPRADDLIVVVRAALDALRLVTRATQEFDPAGSHRRFRLESPDGTHVTMLPRLLRLLESRAPNLRVEVMMVSESPEDALRRGRADIAFMTATSRLKAEFGFAPIAREGWLSLMRSGHPLASATDPLATFLTGRHIAVANNGWTEVLESAMPETRQVVLELPGVLALPGLLADTDLIVTVPQGVGALLAHDPRLHAIRCPVGLPDLGVAMYWAHRHDRDPGHRWLRGLLSEAVGGLSRTPGEGAGGG
jgi:DNA-binding transcriptional LysR family regulator